MHPRNAIAALIVTLAILGAALLAGPASAAAPVVSVEPADPGYTTASLEGEVNPEGKETNCHFDFVNDDQFGIDEWASATQAPCAQNPLNGNTLQAVSAELSNLTPHTTYHLRLVAENEDGTNTDVAPTFETKEVAKPTIEGLAVSGVTTESAHFSAEIDPNGTDPAFNATWSFSCTPSCNATSGGTVSGAADEVQGDATDLDPHTEYTIHLVASNAGGQSEATKSFTTASGPPLVKAFAAGPVQSDQVLLNGEVDPRGSPTTYWFEWGAKDCAANPCQKLASQSAGEGPYYKWAEAPLTGLEPSTTYHFRLVADNALGTTEGKDQQFTTAAPEPGCTNQGQLGTNVLPDCRAWEMVSPPDKNGEDVIPQTSKSHVSTDGNAVTFSAVGGFGDLQGTSFDAEYIARRTAQTGTNGWTTRGINPPGAANSFFAAAFALNVDNGPSYVDAFTPDLSAAVYRSWRPLTDAPNAADFTNLYRIDNLGTHAATPTILTADENTPAHPPSWPEVFTLFDAPVFAAATADLSHVIFESPLSLTADATPYSGFCSAVGFGCPTRLYENTGGVLRQVGRIPTGSEVECDDVNGPPCSAAESAQAGISGTERGIATRMISADGSRIFFQAPFGFSGGQIYLREDGVRTYRLNVSENGPSQFQPARIWDASRDGSRVFFSTSEQLLSDDEDSSEDLYMYDVNKPAGQHLTLISASSSIADPNPNFNSAVAVSDDGQYAYFLSSSQLVSGQPSVFGLALYVWHAGDLNYIGTFQPSEMSDDNGTRATWTFFSSAKTSRVSPDGRYILFMATDAPENRGGYDQDGHREFYLYDADNGRLACVSCNPSGAAAVADAFVNERVGGGVSYSTADLPHSLSDDGRYVFFNTPEALLPEDTNGQPDAYEYDSKTGQISLLSSGTSSSPSLLIDASSDGRNAFFATRQRLSGWDIDDAYDVYDARVGGGLREPLPVTAACEGESCLPGSPPAPPPPPAASQAAGAGNPPRRCPKGTHRARRHGKVRCVKKHRKHKHNKNHKQSHNNRRAGR